MMCCKNKVLVFVASCLVYACFLCSSLFADTITLGGKAGWKLLSVRNGVAEGKGRFGYKCIQLETRSLPADQNADLLLDFENGAPVDRCGNYTVKSNALSATTNAVMGKGAALSRNIGAGLVLSGKRGSLFGTSGPVGSFMIEFWAAPSTADNGEVVFSWRSSRTVNSKIMYQMMSASFVGNRIEWSFFNLFDGWTENGGEVRIAGVRPVIPSKWSFHCISFDSETGMLEYRVDGREEAVVYVTSTGHEQGTVFTPYMGAPADVDIAPLYTGRIDDFCIERNAYTEEQSDDPDFVPGLKPQMFRTSGGRIETQPLLTAAASTLNSVTAVMDTPAQTAVNLFVRSGDNYFNWTDTYPEWKPVKSGERISGVSGLYFQVAADLYPDGNGTRTPSLTELTLDYTRPDAPLPPFTVHAEAGNGSVTLSWSESVDDAAGGYYVYYGTRPGEYLGRSAAEGASPVDVGSITSITLSGLKNGTIYYFAIATKSKYDDRIRGELSKEVYARPALK